MTRSLQARVEKLESRLGRVEPLLIVLKVKGYVETPEDREEIERAKAEGRMVILLNRLRQGASA